MKIVEITPKQKYAEVDITENACPGCYIQLVRDQYGYCIQLVTPMSKYWLCKSVKRISTVNKRLLPYGVRFLVREEN